MFSPMLDPRVEKYSVELLKLPSRQEAEILGGNIQRLRGWAIES